MSDGLETIIVCRSHLEAFQGHIDRAITAGSEAEATKGGLSGVLLQEAEDQINLAWLMQRIECEDNSTPDDPISEPKFTGPIEAMKDLAESMVLDFSEEVQGLVEEPSLLDVKIARHKLDDLEAWIGTHESMTVAEAVA